MPRRASGPSARPPARSSSATASPRSAPPRRRCRGVRSTPASSARPSLDKYQTVAFDANRYSVPRPWAFRAVTVKGYVDRVVVVGRRPGRGRAPAVLRPLGRRSSTRCTTWRRWSAGRRRWTTRRCTATGSRRRRSPACVASWRAGTARRPGRAVHPRPATAGRAPAVAGRAGDRGLPRGACRHGRGDRPADAGPGGGRGRADSRQSRSCETANYPIESRSRLPTCRGSTDCSAGTRRPGSSRPQEDARVMIET